MISIGDTVEANFDRWIDGVDRRLFDVEQIVTSPALMGSESSSDPEFDSVTIGSVVLSTTPPEPVTGVTVTPGTFFDNIFADVEWVESPTGPVAVTFDVELAEKDGAVYTLLSVLSTAGTGGRFGNLQPSRNYGVRVIPVNALGIRGATPAWTDFTTGIDSTVPPAPTGVVLARGATTVVVKYTPLTAVEAADVANGHGLYEIEIDTNVAFNTVNLHQMRSGDQVVAFNDILAEGSWVARVRAIDSSGNVGPWSTTSSPLTAGGVNDSMLIADISAAKITAGFLSASRIQAGTLSADKLMTSSLTAADITLAGGSFKAGSPPTTGILFNSQGIRGYASGSTTFILDAATGAASFVGNISGSSITGGTISGSTITGGTFQTAVSGQRIVIDATSMRFYDTGGTQRASIFGDTGTGAMYISGSVYMSGGLLVNSSVQGSSGLFGYVDAGVSGISSSGPISGTTISSSSSATFNNFMTTPIAIIGGYPSGGADIRNSGLVLGSGTSLTLSSGTVSRGVVDSGGAGFRLLRVPNA